MAEQTIGPDANGMYSRVVDGVVVETWYGTAGVQGGSMAPISNTTTIDRSGTIIPAGTAAPVDPLAAPVPATTTSAPPTTSDGGDWAAPRGGTSDGYGRSGGGGYAPTSSASDDPFATPSPPGEQFPLGDQIAAQVAGPLGDLGPRIAQAAGAAPRPPDFQRQTVSSDAGWAGPGGAGVFGGASVSGGQPRTASERPWQAERAIAGADRPWLGDTGPNLNPRYEAMRAKGDALRGKLRGMANDLRYGGSGGGTGDAAGATTSQEYNQQGRRMDRASDRYNDALYNPDPMKVRGWSKRQGFKPGTIDAALGDPTLLLTSALPGYESRDTPFSEGIESLPMTDLALIMGGTQNTRGLTSRTPVVKVPGILRQQGVKPVKPENKRTLDSSKVANRMAEMYRSLGQPGGDPGWMDQEKLLGNLATARRGGILRQNLRTQFESDPNAAMQSVAGYLRSAMSAGPDTVVSRALIEDVDRQVTNQGRSILRTKPRRADLIIKPLARSYLT